MSDGNAVWEARLVERFKTGDGRAMETLFDLYADRALGLAVRLTETREDAEEVAQEAFLKAFQQARTFRGDALMGFGAWLFAIVRSLAADKRRQLRLPTLSLSAPNAEEYGSSYDAAEEAERRAERAALLGALDRLPEEYRTALTLCDLEDVPHNQAALVLNRSVAATKSLLYRARRALRDELKTVWEN
jgi:RNA polymerase sigma-70 factor, ECF subfamily